jgi:hypothetical protein
MALGIQALSRPVAKALGFPLAGGLAQTALPGTCQVAVGPPGSPVSQGSWSL